MKWRNVDEILPDYDALCVVRGSYEIVEISSDCSYWRDSIRANWFGDTCDYKEWLYFDEVLELIEESEDE